MPFAIRARETNGGDSVFGCNVQQRPHQLQWKGVAWFYQFTNEEWNKHKAEKISPTEYKCCVLTSEIPKKPPKSKKLETFFPATDIKQAALWLIVSLYPITSISASILLKRRYKFFQWVIVSFRVIHYHLSLNLCGCLSVRIIFILRQLIALKLLFIYDSFNKKKKKVVRDERGEQRSKVLMGVSDVSFPCNTSNVNPATINPQQNPIRPNHFHQSWCHFWSIGSMRQ